MLFHGPSGCGKGVIINAFADDLKIPLLTIKCTQLFSKYFGESEKNLRDIFLTAKLNSPIIVHLDEIECIGKKREENSTQSSIVKI